MDWDQHICKGYVHLGANLVPSWAKNLKLLLTNFTEMVYYFLLARFTHSIDSDICQPILIILLAMTFCLDAKINQMNLTNPFPKGTGVFDKVW